MNEVWNLDPIYKGFDDPAYAADMAAMKQLVADFTAFAEELPGLEPLDGLRRGIEMQEKLADLGIAEADAQKIFDFYRRAEQWEAFAE